MTAPTITPNNATELMENIVPSLPTESARLGRLRSTCHAGPEVRCKHMPDFDLDVWYQAQLETLGPDDRIRLRDLTALFVKAGAPDPEQWAMSEVLEDIAQYTRFLFLRAVWRVVHDAVEHAVDTGPGARIRAAGATAEDVRDLLQKTIGDVVFNLLYLIDEPRGTTWAGTDGQAQSDISDSDPGWQLREVDADGQLTGRDVAGLHESVFELAPEEGAGWVWTREDRG